MACWRPWGVSWATLSGSSPARKGSKAAAHIPIKREVGTGSRSIPSGKPRISSHESLGASAKKEPPAAITPPEAQIGGPTVGGDLAAGYLDRDARHGVKAVRIPSHQRMRIVLAMASGK